MTRLRRSAKKLTGAAITLTAIAPSGPGVTHSTISAPPTDTSTALRVDSAFAPAASSAADAYLRSGAGANRSAL